MENHLSVDTGSLQLTCTERHIVGSVTWGKMVATCPFCNIIKIEIQQLNSIVNSLKAENPEPSVNVPVELSHSIHTVHADSVDQREGACGCVSFVETNICISTDERENVDSHITKETEVCKINGPPKERNTLLTIKVEPPPKMLCNTERPVEMTCSYNDVSDTDGGVDMEDLVCTVVDGVDSNTRTENNHNTQTSDIRVAQGEVGSGCPTGAAQGGATNCACCEDIKAEIAKILCTDGIENMESKAKNMESYTIKKLTESVNEKSSLPTIRDETEGNGSEITGQAGKRDFQKSENIPLESPFELNLNGLEEVLAMSNLDSTAVTDERPSRQSELPQRASQLILDDQADLVHNEPGDLIGQGDDFDEDKQYPCEICARRFSTPDGLSMHQVLDHVEKSNGELIGFEKSVSEFVSEKTDTACHKITPITQKQHVCNVCDMRFTREDKLQIHLCQHTGEKPNVCDVCGTGFTTKGKLTSHHRTHTGEKPFKCAVCDMRCSTQGYFTIHYRRHTGETPYICEVCDQGFTRLEYYKVHLMKHTGEKPYVCEVCKKRFCTQSLLHRHKQIHTGEKPYKCEDCGKGFTRKDNLLGHLQTHQGEKPYKCKDCDKEFLQNFRLREHSKIHLDEKPYVCNICEKGFTRKYHLKKHHMTHR